MFCAPEKPGAKADPLRAAAEEKGLKVHQFKSLRGEDAHEALKALKVDLGIMAYVLQFAPTASPRSRGSARSSITRRCCRNTAARLRSTGRSSAATRAPGSRSSVRTKASTKVPIVLQKECDIGPDDTLGDVYFNNLFPMGVQAMLEAADLVAAGKHARARSGRVAGDATKAGAATPKRASTGPATSISSTT